MCLVIVWGSKRIWSIEVVGNENIKSEEIIRELALEKFAIGAKKEKLNFEEVKSNIYLRRQDVLWLGFEIKGTKAIVEVEERTLADNEKENDIPSNIVANKNGIIESIYVKNGVACVNVGDMVLSGEMLVTGMVTSEYSDTRFVCADAEIKVRTWHDQKCAIPYEKNVLTKTGNIDYEYKLRTWKIYNKFIKY